MTDLGSIYYPVGDSYPDCLRRLYAINGSLNRNGIEMPSDGSLENTRKLYDLIGKPLDRIPTIHIGGTNGKGSTSYKIAQCLKNCGLKSGLFVSPHISSFRERIQVNNVIIPEGEVIPLLKKVIALCVDNNIPATLFEVTFIMACLYFDMSGCDAAVIEVGLGGKLDATNVMSTVCSVLCSVSLDHTRILGSTVEAIARVKSGIFRPNRPAIVGMGTPIDLLRSESALVGADFHVVNDLISAEKITEYSFLKCMTSIDSDDIVDTDAINTNLTLATLSLLPRQHDVFRCVLDHRFEEGIAQGAASRPPCRWETLSIPVERWYEYLLVCFIYLNIILSLISKPGSTVPQGP